MLTAPTQEQLDTLSSYRIKVALSKSTAWQTACGVNNENEALLRIHWGFSSPDEETLPYALISAAKSFADYTLQSPLTGFAQFEYVIRIEDALSPGVSIENGFFKMEYIVREIWKELQSNQDALYLKFQPAECPVKGRIVQTKSKSPESQRIYGYLGVIAGLRGRA